MGITLACGFPEQGRKPEGSASWGVPSIEPINALVITAHPDDETVFMGGTILKNRSWSWLVICVTCPNDVRKREFESACEAYRELGVRLRNRLLCHPDIPDHRTGGIDIKQLCRQLKTLSLKPNIVFTHNSIGEYDHAAHKAVNKVVNRLFNNIWEFICPGAKNYPQPYLEKTKEISLTEELLRKKKDIFCNCYRSQYYLWCNFTDIMEYEFTRGPEVFTQQSSRANYSSKNTCR